MLTSTTTIAPDEQTIELVVVEKYSLSPLDEPVAPGLRLWMLLAMITGLLLFMSLCLCVSLSRDHWEGLT